MNDVIKAKAPPSVTVDLDGQVVYIRTNVLDPWHVLKILQMGLSTAIQKVDEEWKWPPLSICPACGEEPNRVVVPSIYLVAKPGPKG